MRLVSCPHWAAVRIMRLSSKEPELTCGECADHFAWGGRLWAWIHCRVSACLAPAIMYFTFEYLVCWSFGDRDAGHEKVTGMARSGFNSVVYEPSNFVNH